MSDHAREKEPLDPPSPAPRQTADETGWQPIETAPKDEDVLLFSDDDGVRSGYWYDLEPESQFWYAVETQGITGGRMKATHWMPLPNPPALPTPREDR